MKQDRYIREWYSKKYRDDVYGRLTLRRRYTFLEWAKDMVLLGSEEGMPQAFAGGRYRDSLVRERLFAKLAELLEVDYDVVYNYWLGIGDGEEWFKQAYREACEKLLRA